MLAAYMSLDRPETLFAVRASSRGSSYPSAHMVQVFKRIARYYRKRPRLVQWFQWQPLATYLDLWSDSDHAGDRFSRKSTSGVVAMTKDHCILTRCKGQSVIALSSGEAELHAFVLTCSVGIGLQQLFEDLGLNLKIRVSMGASAAMSMARRPGLGNTKHVGIQLFIGAGTDQK